jgi:hypothetical protein
VASPEQEHRPAEQREPTAPAGTAPLRTIVVGEEGAGGPDASRADEENPVDAVEQPAKVMRIGAMTRQLLEEVRQATLDDASRNRLKEIYETSVRELASSLSPDLAAELDRLALPFDNGTPSDAEIRVAQAQLVGWLEGLFHGIQATLFAQQMAARSQLEDFRQRGLPPGSRPDPRENRPGNYL